MDKIDAEEQQEKRAVGFFWRRDTHPPTRQRKERLRRPPSSLAHLQSLRSASCSHVARMRMVRNRQRTKLHLNSTSSCLDPPLGQNRPRRCHLLRARGLGRNPPSNVAEVSRNQLRRPAFDFHPPFSSASLATCSTRRVSAFGGDEFDRPRPHSLTALMSLNRSLPSCTPPYQRLTTTRTSCASCTMVTRRESQRSAAQRAPRFLHSVRADEEKLTCISSRRKSFRPAVASPPSSKPELDGEEKR